MSRFFAILLFAAATANAQTPSLPPGLPPGLTIPGLNGPSVGSGKGRYVQVDTPSKRFADSDVAGPTFQEGAAVIVLVEDGARVRISKGDDYGWVPKSVLGESMPATPAPTPPSAP
jgi:hypothetical protein